MSLEFSDFVLIVSPVYRNYHWDFLISMETNFDSRVLEKTAGIIWWFGLFGYYGASLGSALIFADSGSSMNYGELVFSCLGEIFGVTLAMCLAWRISVHTLQPWFYLFSTLACIAVVIAHILKAPALLLGTFAFILRAASMGAISITWVLTPTAFPTHVRSTAHSILYAAGSLGPVCASLWPEDTSLTVIMASYGAANLVCAILAQWQTKGLAAHLGHALNFFCREIQERILYI